MQVLSLRFWTNWGRKHYRAVATEAEGTCSSLMPCQEYLEFESLLQQGADAGQGLALLLDG